MKASEYRDMLKGVTTPEDQVAALVRDAIAKGAVEDDLGLSRPAASKMRADLIAKGMSEEHATAQVDALVKAGVAVDDAAEREGDAMLKAVEATVADLTKAGAALDAALTPGEPPTVDPDATEGALFKSAAELVAAKTDEVVAAVGAGYRALHKGQLAQVESDRALIKAFVQTQAAVAGLDRKLDTILKSLGQPLPGRALTGAGVQPHPGEYRPQGDAAALAARRERFNAAAVAKIQDPMTDSVVKSGIAHAVQEVGLGADPALFAAQLGITL